MDKLDTMFRMQQKLNEDIIRRRGLEGISNEEWIQKQTLAMLSEMAELLDEVNFKWWKNPKPIDADAVREELVDILHFFLSMCLCAGMDAEDLYRRYLNKNEENFKRQEGTSEKPGYAMPHA
ncbi:MAG TPA: dUTP diphosphatase [Candidatus Avichristensenella intestinipullorum]|jgi:dimeric dUTPase (all-alpha-NTP-PPase superfamily)|uniref:dUTP diphosphatase n=1 Tax=Candidatus Avichristensenella intestinipullorum TaxID=2840693 RepID=A0A9D1CJR2_9FIRM|nr:dUTP diphosphatase [Candidatus Avichristensenella intestinipullorum]